jgi:hypothetical protein
MGLRTVSISSKFRKSAAVFAATLTLGATLAGVVVQGATSLAGATTSGVPRCTTGDLDVWLNTSGNGAAGSTYFNLEFTNLSAHACTVSGYPGVSAVGFSNQQLGIAASHNPQQPVSVVTLSSGSTKAGTQGFQTGNTATVVLAITEAGNYSPSACHAVVAEGLRVYPPDQTASKMVPYPFVACSKRGPLILHVEAIQKGLLGQ